VDNKLGRRGFLRAAGLGVGGLGLAALTNAATAQDDMGDMNMTGNVGTNWGEMDAHHQAGVDTFLANIGKDPEFWNTPMAFEMDGDVRVFKIAVQDIAWEVSPGQSFPAMAYNGRVPGPEIRVTEGDKVRFLVTNEMAGQSTAVHWHGLRVPNSMDGVPFITQPVIAPGETFTYEFTVRNAGTHMYHSHHNAAEQVTLGLLGAFIVEPQDKSREPEVSADYTMVLNDSGIGFTINGKSFPYTQPIIAKLGDKIRVRYMNEGLMIHPMHLHGIPQLVFAKDGFYLPAPYMCDTLNIAPGERYDVIVECDEPGAWAFHCHILTHAESRNGMFGMVTALVVQE
jgi:FtsP/CotA-like multicopper oxidase with cupredoxin domain